MAIKDGYFANIFKDEVKRTETIKIKEKEKFISFCIVDVPVQSIAMLVLFSTMVGSWANFLVNQHKGLYFKEVHKNCTVIDNDENGLTYLSWGNGECDPLLFNDDCGLDGGDCNNDCSTYFQFNVPDSRFVYNITNKPVLFDYYGNAYSNSVLSYYRVNDYDDDLIGQFYLEYQDECNDDNFFNLTCEAIPRECKNEVISNEFDVASFISECFSPETIYKNNPEQDHWYCWFGVDSITIPRKDTNDIKKVLKSSHLKSLKHGG